MEYARAVLPESRQIDGRCAVSRLEALRPVRAAPRSDHEPARRCNRERAARSGQIDRDNASGDVPPPNDAHDRRDDARLAASHTHTHARPRRDDATTRAVAFQAALDRIESIEGELAERFESIDRASLTRIEGELVEVHRARDTVVARDAQVERAA